MIKKISLIACFLFFYYTSKAQYVSLNSAEVNTLKSLTLENKGVEQIIDDF